MIEFSKKQIKKAKELAAKGFGRTEIEKALNEIFDFEGGRKCSSRQSSKFVKLYGPDSATEPSNESEVYDVAKGSNITTRAAKTKIAKAKELYRPAEDELRKATVSGATFISLKRQFGFKTLEQARKEIEEVFPDCYCTVYSEDGETILYPSTSSAAKYEELAGPRRPVKFKYTVDDTERYMCITFDDDIPASQLKIGNFTDVHFGSKAHLEQKFDKILKWIQLTPGFFAFDGGDTGEFNSRQSAGDPMEQFLSNNEQVEYAVRKYSQIDDRNLFKLGGNHDSDRGMKFGQFDPARVIAQFMRVPYFKYPVIVDLIWRGNRWRLYAAHEWNRAIEQSQVVKEVRKMAEQCPFMVHFFCSGHNHTAFIQRENVEDILVGKGMVTKDYYVVNGGSFVRKNKTYAQRFRPVPQDFTYLVLDESGQYWADSVKINSL